MARRPQDMTADGGHGTGQRFGRSLRLLLAVTICLLVPPVPPSSAATLNLGPRAAALMDKITPRVRKDLAGKGFQLGAPIFIRIFKLDGILEVWLKKNRSFQLFKTYPICKYSGYPGPKLFEGDWQSPEGFYSVGPAQMNPRSQYHLSFDVGYPNAYDRARKRTGSSIMVHGGCSSRGCFAMTDHQIEEIFLLAYSALANGQQRFGIHIFPFRLTRENLAKFSTSPWIGFWRNLEKGYAAFEQTHQPPLITVKDGQYLVTEQLRLALLNSMRQRDNMP